MKLKNLTTYSYLTTNTWKFISNKAVEIRSRS